MSKKNANEPIVDDELLENAGAEPEENTLGDEVEAELEEQLDATEVVEENEHISALEARLAEQDDRHLRLRAEFDNYKRRIQRERLELMDTAGRKTMLSLLPVLDDFDRAAKQAESDEATKQVWDSGVGLIVKKLYTA
ncbi:MAG: nucleotide exchange factor GrpE, partial [Bacteroidota bacterium]